MEVVSLRGITYTGWKDCICEIRRNGQDFFSSQWFKLGIKENIINTIIAPYDEWL